MIEQIATMLHQRARHRLWLISDLQQSIPENATLCMRAAAEDFAALSLPCQYIFPLFGKVFPLYNIGDKMHIFTYDYRLYTYLAIL